MRIAGDKVTEISRNDLCLSCVVPHKRKYHNADGCMVPGCGCTLDYYAPRSEVPR